MYVVATVKAIYVTAIVKTIAQYSYKLDMLGVATHHMDTLQ